MEDKRRRPKFPALYPILDAELVLRGVADAGERRAMLQRLVWELAEAGVEILQYRNKRDADDLEPVVSHAHGFAQDVRVPGEATRPIVVAQDRHGIRAGSPVVIGREQAAESGP